jgi:hypothetical protein
MTLQVHLHSNQHQFRPSPLVTRSQQRLYLIQHFPSEKTAQNTYCARSTIFVSFGKCSSLRIALLPVQSISFIRTTAEGNSSPNRYLSVQVPPLAHWESSDPRCNDALRFMLRFVFE